MSRHAIAGTACGTAGEAEGRSAAMKGSQLQWGPMLLGDDAGRAARAATVAGGLAARRCEPAGGRGGASC